MLKVLLQARQDGLTKFGGDTYQFMKYRESAKVHGCEIVLTTNPRPDLNGYDVYHVNNLDVPGILYAQMKRARKRGVPVALMPIHHRRSDVWRYYRWLASTRWRYLPFRSKRLKELSKEILQRQWTLPLTTPWFKGVEYMQRFCIDSASAVMLNAKGEGEAVAQELGVALRNTIVVPNGVESLEDIERSKFTLPPLPEEYGVVVGRIEPRKNQLAVLDVRREFGIPVVFVGALNKAYGWYANRFRQEIRRTGCHWVGAVEPEIVKAIVRRAKVSVLPSWFEVVAYGSIDAFAAGTRVVTTERGYLTEYLRDAVSYCKPESPESIVKCVAHEMARAPDPEEHARFASEFTWNLSAKQLVKGYEICLNDERGG